MFCLSTGCHSNKKPRPRLGRDSLLEDAQHKITGAEKPQQIDPFVSCAEKLFCENRSSMDKHGV